LDTRYLYNNLESLLGGDKVKGAIDMDYGDWSPSNLRSLICTAEGYIAIYHTPVNGVYYKSKALNSTKVAETLSATRPANPFQLFSYKNFSAIEEVIIDNTFGAFDPKQLLQTTVRMRKIATTSNNFRYILNGVQEYYANPANRENPDILSNLMPVDNLLYIRDVSEPDYRECYTLVPRVYSLDKGKLKDYFTKLDPSEGTSKEVESVDSAGYSRELISSIKEDKRHASLVNQYCTIFMFGAKFADNNLDESFNAAFHPRGVVWDMFKGLPPQTDRMYEPIDKYLEKMGSSGFPCTTTKGYIDIDELKTRVTELASIAKASGIPLPEKPSNLLYWLEQYQNRWGTAEDSEVGSDWSEDDQSESDWVDEDEAGEVGVGETEDWDEPELSVIAREFEDDDEYGPDDTYMFDEEPLSSLADIYFAAKKKKPVLARYILVIAGTHPNDGSYRINKFEDNILKEFLRELNYSSQRTVDFEDIQGRCFTDLHGVLEDLSNIVNMRTGATVGVNLYEDGGICETLDEIRTVESL